MGLMFEPSEVFRIAVRIEENGERFYREMARKFDQPGVAAFFTELAEEESRHGRYYRETLAQLEPIAIEEEYTGQYLAQLQAYADEVLFSEREHRKRLRVIRSLPGALAFAMRTELDSICYYQEIRNLVPPSRRGAIDAIVEEERRHLLRLSTLRSGTRKATRPPGPASRRGAVRAAERAAGGVPPASQDVPREIQEIVREAVQLEVEGRSFFQHAAAATGNPLGQRVFQRLAAAESEHLRTLAELLGAWTGGEGWERYLRDEEQRSSAIVADLRQRIAGSAPRGGADELEALRIGMELERKAIDLFERMAAHGQTVEARELAEKIGEQERAHYDLLQAQYDSVTSSGFWFDAAEFSLDGEF